MADHTCADAVARRLHHEMRVRYGSTPETIQGALLDDIGLLLSDREFLFRTPSGVRMHYALGKGIVAREPVGPAQEDELRVYLWGTVFGSVAWLNGYFPLHASAVELDGRVVAFTADSGGGKSTLAAALAASGCAQVADDTLPLFRHGGAFYAVPDGKPQKLWDDAARFLESKRLGEVGLQPGKFYARPAEAVSGPLPLTDLIVLETADSIGIESVIGADKMRELAKAMYRPMVRAALGDQAGYWGWLAALAAGLRIWRLRRPTQRLDPDIFRLVETLVRTLEP